MILCKKKSPEKKSYYSGKCIETKGVYNHGKKGAIDTKYTPGYIQYADA